MYYNNIKVIFKLAGNKIGISITNGAKSLGFDWDGNLLSDFGKWDTTHSKMNWAKYEIIEFNFNFKNCSLNIQNISTG